jgi:hypothetical protein
MGFLQASGRFFEKNARAGRLRKKLLLVFTRDLETSAGDQNSFAEAATAAAATVAAATVVAARPGIFLQISDLFFRFQNTLPTTNVTSPVKITSSARSNSGRCHT